MDDDKKKRPRNRGRAKFPINRPGYNPNIRGNAVNIIQRSGMQNLQQRPEFALMPPMMNLELGAYGNIQGPRNVNPHHNGNRFPNRQNDHPYVMNNNQNHRINFPTGETNANPRNSGYVRNKQTIERSNSNGTQGQARGPQFPSRNNDSGSRNFVVYRLGFKKLEDLANKDSNDIIIQLANAKTGFYELLEEKLSDDYVVLVLKVLSKMCESSYDQNKAHVLSLLTSDNFLSQLIHYILRLPFQDEKEKRKNGHFWKDVKGFFENCVVISKNVIEKIPTIAYEKLPKLLKVLWNVLPQLEDEQDIELVAYFEEKLQNIHDKLEIITKDIEARNIKRMSSHNKQDVELEELGPPDDFRLMTVYPSRDELLIRERPFVRKNLIEGAYKNAHHYLDVQFRLLREDFIGPLRTSICSYRDPNSKKRIENVKIHKKVQFVEKSVSDRQVGTVLNFNLKGKLKMKENTKRFMYGSLVCFTKPDFQSIFFGKIIDRKHVKDGIILIDLVDACEAIQYGVDYVMIECNIYFEPYFQVLNALKSFQETDFPLEKYILYVDTEAEEPGYFNELNHRIMVDSFHYSLHDFTRWPSALQLKLNQSQYEAFKTALTQKLVVMQGPPGTGKTYMGLKIARTLIENVHIWYKHRPILVICYTNHALDQFLEGLSTVTQNIIRVGGQSKSEKIQQFNIRNMKGGKRDKSLNSLYFNHKEEMRNLLSIISRIQCYLKAVSSNDGIVRINNLENLDNNVRSTCIAKFDYKDMIEWLMEGSRGYRTQRAPDNKIEVFDESDESDVDEPEDQLDLDEKLIDMKAINHDPYLIRIANLVEEIGKLQNLLLTLKNKANTNQKITQAIQTEQTLLHLISQAGYLTEIMGLAAPVINQPANCNYNFPYQMTLKQRWQLYFYWLHLFETNLKKEQEIYTEKFRDLSRRFDESRDMMDLHVMKDALVVGMTTTGAARMHTTLQALKCNIVIVEEAAEVLESHVVVCLTKHCEHLILIGDHQQLRPSTSNYYMETTFNLGISMFERMVRNKMGCNTLNIQHRMRPEIAELITPAIYPTLDNSESVLFYRPILGVQKSLYFIHHTEPEKVESDEECSKENIHEVKYFLNLARYLIQNGYKAEDITILSAYTAQMFLFWKHRKHFKLLDNVKITVLDNYQGEESTIILLSLVRNVPSTSIGFLKIENRVCVALSRAREGMFIMGNMDLLCEKSEIWPKIREVLERQNAIGPCLNLECLNHNVVTEILTEKDFAKVPEGGCTELCAKSLACGHNCSKMCHPTGMDHITYKCTEICNEILCDRMHACPKFCYEECAPCAVLIEKKLPCEHIHNVPCSTKSTLYSCPTLVQRVLPCKHEVEMQCYLDPEQYVCPVLCDTRIEPCGHSCAFRCHAFKDPDHLEYKCLKPCAKFSMGCTQQLQEHLCTKLCYEDCIPCIIQVKKHRTTCPHVFNVACNEDVDAMECPKPCKKKLPCGHACQKKCYEPCEPCNVVVPKSLSICGHSVKTKCNAEPDIRKCKGKCALILNCGHPCEKKCNEPCTTQCRALVVNSKKGDCGHEVKTACYLANSDIKTNSFNFLKHCQEPCKEKLLCAHNCHGTCGECAQGRVHKPCQEKCGVILVCGHECTIPCRETCRPCQLPCSYKCVHSKCKRKCGEVCTSCKERCPRSCVHVKCTNKCGQICSVPPCTMPCIKKLQCGHDCVGFCGDKCPPLCRICDEEELTEIFFGSEDDEDARFVLLEECGHVVESSGMDMWLEKDGNEIGAKYCPKCKTALTSTPRFSGFVKAACADIALVKKKYYGNDNEIRKIKKHLLYSVLLNNANYSILMASNKTLQRILQGIRSTAEGVQSGRRLEVDIAALNALRTKMDLLEDILKIYKPYYAMSSALTKYFSDDLFDYFLHMLMRNENVFSQQEMDDLNWEVKRFNRTIQFFSIIESASDYCLKKDEVKTEYLRGWIVTNSLEKYTDARDTFFKSILEKLKISTKSGLNISDTERREILKAIGLSQGHWYKCPNGHVYVIGECGGAMQESKCNECGATIGGQSHRLLSDNAVATEMDGARHSAFSDAANMGNYML